MVKTDTRLPVCCERTKTSIRIKVPQLKFEGHLMNRNQVPQVVLTDITSIVLRTFWHNSDKAAAVLVDRCLA